MIVGALALVLVLIALLIYLIVSRTARESAARTKANAKRKQARPIASNRVASGVFEVGGREAQNTPVPPPQVPPELQDFNLFTIDDVELKERQAIQTIYEAMPPPHPIQSQLVGGLDTPEELKETVVLDAGLTAAVLRTVNSAAFGLSSPITSVQHAITYLGVTAVKGLVTQAAFSERSPTGTPQQQASLDKIWKAARYSGAFAQMIGQEFALPRLSVVATSALLANLGDVALATTTIESLEDFEDNSTLLYRAKQQQAKFGFNSFIVGSALAKHWGLPPELALSIASSGLLLTTAPKDYPLPKETLHQNLIIYTACRLGDAIAYRKIDDIDDFGVDDSDNSDLFFWRQYLQVNGLSRVKDLFSDAGFKRKANRLINTLG
jgi:HD-like signal output (HDOD) protein